MHSKQLFGTDGIRGVAGEYPLDPGTVFAAGLALGHWAVHHQVDATASNGHEVATPEVVIGIDTRESGPGIAACLAGGLVSAGVSPRFAGVVSTPGIAYLTRTDRFVAGVIISASHNPFEDNGIKVFGHSGYKLPDAEEHRLEQHIFEILDNGPEPRATQLTIDETLDSRYLDYLVSIAGHPLDGMRLALDCGNGAVSRLAPELFRRLGARVTSFHDQPDGRNINAGCGALHAGSLASEVVRLGADAGVAFDGDADRAIFISSSGAVVDGDAVLLMSAVSMAERGVLDKPLVVSTVMSNIGLERALAERGLQMIRTAVGDKYVLEEMVRRGAMLGGEQSGHVIFRDCATTGDGMLTAIRVFELMRHSGRSLGELAAELRVFPQLLVNVRVKNKRPLAELPAVQSEIAASQAAFGDSGRVVVRFSGTEPLARVMVEGPDSAQVELWANRIADAIRGELG